MPRHQPNYHSRQYFPPANVVTCSCDAPTPDTANPETGGGGNIGDWHIQTLQQDKVTLHVNFFHFEEEVGWRLMFSIPISNPMPQIPLSWPNPQQPPRPLI
jgi:hypothetical protein